MKTQRMYGSYLILITLLAMITVIPQINMASGKMQHQKSDANGRVLLLTNWDPKTKSAVAISLGLDTRINLTIFGKVDDNYMAIRNYTMSNFDVVVCDSYLPIVADDQLWLRNEMLANNVSLLFFGGNYTTGLANFDDLIPAYFNIDRNMLNSTVSQILYGSLQTPDTVTDDYLYLVYNSTKETQIMRDQIQVAVEVKESEIDQESSKRSIFTKNIAWQSCPLLRERVFTFSNKNGSKTLVEVPNTAEPLIVVANISEVIPTTSKSKVIFISTGVGNITFYEDSDGNPIAPESKQMNEPFKLWPYFNYLMYLCIFFLDYDFDHSLLESYADWPWSPIPHEKEAAIWMTFVACLWIFNFVLFFTLGKKKKARDAQLKTERPLEIPPSDSTTTTTPAPSPSSTDTTTMPPKDPTPSGDKETTMKPPE